MKKNAAILTGVVVIAIVIVIALFYSIFSSLQDGKGNSVGASSSGEAVTSVNPGTASNEASSSSGNARDGADTAENMKRVDLHIPEFDLLRVEPDGSVVIAGKSAVDAQIDVISGSKILGSSRTGAQGDFVILFDEALQPGDYQLVLRATGADGSVATSLQTAIVSVPESRDGQLLALVEQPGQASRMISMPKGETPDENAKLGGDVSDEATDTKPSSEQSTASDGVATLQTPAADDKAPSGDLLAIEAVEIEGETIFVAGHAKEGRRVSVYANDIALGNSPVSGEGRFLVQSSSNLPVGDYIIRADLADVKGNIIASARVPFRREVGENISAVAPLNAQGLPTINDQGLKAETAAPLERVDGSVIIRKGDNLWTISKRAYGKGTRYTTIYLANRDQIRNPDLIWPGQVFVMPKEPLPNAGGRDVQP